MQKPEIAREILAYLIDHPEAQDTLDGVVQWWLLEQEIKYQIDKVKEALVELVGKGLVLERQDGRMRNHYGVNPHKVEEIRAMLKQKSE